MVYILAVHGDDHPRGVRRKRRVAPHHLGHRIANGGAVVQLHVDGALAHSLAIQGKKPGLNLDEARLSALRFAPPNSIKWPPRGHNAANRRECCILPGTGVRLS